MRMMKHIQKTQRLLFIGIMAMLLIAGCGNAGRNPVPPQESVKVVQEAVDRYVLTHQTPPVKPTDAGAGSYEQYPVNFRTLIKTLQLSEVPPNAYENGGPYYYVLLQDDDKWHVKLIDMIIWQTVSDIQAKTDQYIERNGRLPAGEEIASGIYRLDAKALGLNDDNVRSVYSPQMLPLIVTSDGQVVIDYAFEIMRMIQSLGDQFEPTDDLRDVLVTQSFMLPIHSLPYEWAEDQPVIRYELAD